MTDTPDTAPDTGAEPGAPAFIDAAAVDRVMTWPAIVDALAEGHKGPAADVNDMVLTRGARTLLNRAAWIEGRGLGLKTVTVFPDNARAQPPRPTVQGVFILFDDDGGAPKAVIDGAAITRWKTVGDSLLGARFLARPDARRLLIVGAGTIAGTLARAYGVLFAGLDEIRIWNRTPDRARDLADALAKEPDLKGRVAWADSDLADEVGAADVIETATLAREPVIRGDWLTPGTHLGLIGAYRADMREADDAALKRGRLFVDARATTIGEIGELIYPMQSGAITEADVLGEFRDLVAGAPGRVDADDITVFKNGGGAHLDLMTAHAIFAAFAAAGRGG